MDNMKTKKELIAEYKEREISGGIYIIKNTKNGKILVGSTTDMKGFRNRFEFSQKTASCVNIKLQRDWEEYGGVAFEFEILEEIDKKDTQTDKEFREDVEFLKKIWYEKMDGKEFY